MSLRNQIYLSIPPSLSPSPPNILTALLGLGQEWLYCTLSWIGGGGGKLAQNLTPTTPSKRFEWYHWPKNIDEEEKAGEDGNIGMSFSVLLSVLAPPPPLGALSTRQ